MRRLVFFLTVNFILQAASYLYAEPIYIPSYRVEDALAVPSHKEIAVDLLWENWKSLPGSSRGKTGLVLSGGGGRGFGHVGVLHHLEEVEFPIEAITGTSMGAVVGGLYAAGVPILSIEKMAEEAGFKKLARPFTTMTFIKLGLSNGLASADAWKNWLDENLGDKTFADLKIPFIACVMDLASGELVLLREGPLATALLGAGTIPGLFAPVALRQYFLVDGGVLLNVPVETMSLLKADNVLISDVSARDKVDVMTRPPSSIMTLYRIIEVQGNRLEHREYRNGDYRLRFYPSITLLELWRWREAWEAGLTASRENSTEMRLAFIRKAVLRLGASFLTLPLSSRTARAGGREDSVGQ